MADNAVPTGAARRERLARRRKELGLTQEALAGLLGVERSTVVRWERGDTEPQPWFRPKLAKALRVSAERLEELLTSSAGGQAGPDAAGGPAGRAGPGDTPGRDRMAPAVPRQLPATAMGFTGRAAELQALTRILDEAAGGAAGTVVISAIGGTAGVGKTALALHWSHQIAGRFGDGQLHVNLRGFDPSGTPASPAEVIRGFLDALGVPPDKIPAAHDAQAGLYRSVLADRKMLIVLDNARDERQVRPLLPASPASLVIVTSRNQLAGLAAADGARLVHLDVLTHAEAVQLLIARVGASRADAEPGAIAEIATLCACLPLALTVAAARAAARAAFPLSALAAELRGTASRLDALDAGDPAANVRAVFSWSYQQLGGDAARMFRLLGLAPGPDISVPAAASLAGLSGSEARRLLHELAHSYLIEEHVPGRFAFHDLLRAYAAAQARDTDTEAERKAAVSRVLEHYLHAAGHGSMMVDPAREHVTLARPSPGVVPWRAADHRQALAWFEAEHHVLAAAVTLAAEWEFDVHAWQLPWAMMPFLRIRGRHQEWAANQRTALAAATRLGDTAGQAISSRLLASACMHLRDYEQALSHYAGSLELYRRLGNRDGEAKAQQNLSVLAERQTRYADAIGHAEEARRLYQAMGDRAGEAHALNTIGWQHTLLGQYEQARVCCRQALDFCAEVGDRRLGGHAWDSLGYAEHHLGNFADAAACYDRALGIFREFRDRFHEATILTHLGDTRHAGGDLPRARDAWHQALAIFEDLDHPRAEEVSAKLASLPPPVTE